MPTYKVWDDEDGTIDDAVVTIAKLPSDAAEAYAADDRDGQRDGVYNTGRRIGVMDENGNITKWEITVEYDPSFYSIPV